MFDVQESVSGVFSLGISEVPGSGTLDKNTLANLKRALLTRRAGKREEGLDPEIWGLYLLAVGATLPDAANEENYDAAPLLESA